MRVDQWRQNMNVYWYRQWLAHGGISTAYVTAFFGYVGMHLAKVQTSELVPKGVE